MNRAALIISEKSETLITADMVERYPDVLPLTNSQVLSAMEQQAVDFALWLDKNNWLYNTITQVWDSLDNDDTHKNLSALYQSFNANKQ